MGVSLYIPWIGLSDTRNQKMNHLPGPAKGQSADMGHVLLMSWEHLDPELAPAAVGGQGGTLDLPARINHVSITLAIFGLINGMQKRCHAGSM
jgi:hypothetical protein